MLKEAKTSSLKLLNWLYVIKRHVALFLIIPFVVCLFLASGIFSLKANNDGRIFFDEDSIERQQLLTLEQRFTEQNSLLLILSTQQDDLFNAKALQAILWLTEQAWQLPHVVRVNSLSNYQYITSEEDDLIIENLIPEGITFDQNDLRLLKQKAFSEADLMGQILSQDGKTTAIALNVVAPRGDSAAIRDIMIEIEKLKSAIAKDHPDLGFYVTGDVPLDHAFGEAFAQDLTSLFPYFLLSIMIMSYFFFRSLKFAMILSGMMIMVVVATMGAAAFLNIDLTTGTSGVPVILITIALADFIHLLSSTRQGIVMGLGKCEAIEASLQHNFLPITLTSFTTFIGFISLNFNDAPPFRDMGNLVALGIVFSYLMTFSFFPALLYRINLTKEFAGEEDSFSVPSRFVNVFSNGLIRWNKAVLFIMVTVTIVISAGIGRIELDDDWVKYFDKNNPFRKDTEFVVQHLSGVDSIEYMLSAGEGSSVTEATFLNRLKEFEKWALLQPEINQVSSIVSLFRKMNYHMNGGQEEFNRISENSGLNAQYLLMYEMSLPVGLDLNDRIDIEKKATRVTIIGKDLTSRQMRDLDDRVSQKLEDMHLIAENEKGTGIPLMFANLSERNIKSMLTGIVFALGLVSLVIILAFKSLKMGLISFVVNIMPIILGFGIWGWFYQYVGLSLTIVAAIAFGIIVDDSIHFITKYTKMLTEKRGEVADVLKATFSEVGGALIITTAVLVVGFSLLSLSTFQPTWALGLISALMILIALTYDFLLLPVLLYLMEGENSSMNKKKK